MAVVPLVVYSAQRLALFVAALLVLFWLHLGGWLLVLLAAVIAWALSYVLLGRSRDRAALWIADRVEARSREPATRTPTPRPRTRRPRTPRRRRAAAVRPASQGQAEPQEDAVAELEQAGPGQDGAQQDPARADQHGGGQQRDRQGEQQHEQ